MQMAERLENQDRINRGLIYRVFGEMAHPPDEVAPLPALVDQLWARLRITPNEIKRRMKVAARIRPRRQLAGPALPPELPAVAAAVQAGRIGEDHLRVITAAMDVLPSCVTPVERAEVEASLVGEAVKSDADIVKASAKAIDAIFNPDGDYDEADRPGGALWWWVPRAATACRRCRDGSTPRPAAISTPRPPRCARAATCPTARWLRCAMTAARPSAAMTASNWV